MDCLQVTSRAIVDNMQEIADRIEKSGQHRTRIRVCPRTHVCQEIGCCSTCPSSSQSPPSPQPSSDESSSCTRGVGHATDGCAGKALDCTSRSSSSRGRSRGRAEAEAEAEMSGGGGGGGGGGSSSHIIEDRSGSSRAAPPRPARSRCRPASPRQPPPPPTRPPTRPPSWRPATGSPRAFIFSLENAGCKDSYKCCE